MTAGLTSAQCVAQADKWAMLSRRSEEWLWLAKKFGSWRISLDARRCEINVRLEDFLGQRHAAANGWNRAVKTSWESRFNDFYLFALTARITDG